MRVSQCRLQHFPLETLLRGKSIKNTLGYHYNCIRWTPFVSTPLIVLFSSKLTEYINKFTKTHPNTSLHHFLGSFCSQKALKWCQSHKNSAQGGPRTTKVIPKWSKRVPKGIQRVPKGIQRDPKEPPIDTQMSLKCSQRDLWGTQEILRVQLSYRARVSSCQEGKWAYRSRVSSIQKINFLLF